MAKIEFDNEFSRLMEELNASAGARERRSRIVAALDLCAGLHVLDVGSGPGHQAAAIAQSIGPDGRIDGVDVSTDAVESAHRRCKTLGNANFSVGNAYDLPFEGATFDRATSSQVFEYLDDLPKALNELFRVLKLGGRMLVQGTGWPTLLWHSDNPERMVRVLRLWERHLADPRMPETLGKKITDAGFVDVQVEPIVQIETKYDPTSKSAIVARFIHSYVVSQGLPEVVADEWMENLKSVGARGAYFYSANEYIFTATKPA